MFSVAIVVVSDSCFAQTSKDSTGPALQSYISAQGGYEVKTIAIVPDDKLKIMEAVLQCRNHMLILTAGGTGFSPNDVTPEVSLLKFV